MRTREIPYERWSYFFDDFTRLHQGEHVNVETMDDEASNLEARLHDLPLVGIVGAAVRAGSGHWIEVIAGDSPDAETKHCVARPSRVVVAEEHGQAVALQIESADGLVTMLRFEPPREAMPQGFTLE